MQKFMLDNILSLVENQDYENASFQIINRIEAKDADYIDDLVMNLNILTERATELVKLILPSLLLILDSSDDMIRYSLIASLQKFVAVNEWALYQYIDPYLKADSAKKREGMLYLLKYIADSESELLIPFIDTLISLVNDPEPFIRNKAMEFLIVIGKKDPDQMEIQLTQLSQNSDDAIFKQNLDLVRKELIH